MRWRKKRCDFPEHAEPCQHVWKIIGASYTPPRAGGGSVTGFIGQAEWRLMQDITYGFTTVTDQCQSTCQQVRTRKLTGRAELPGFQWRTTRVSSL